MPLSWWLQNLPLAIRSSEPLSCPSPPILTPALFGVSLAIILAAQFVIYTICFVTKCVLSARLSCEERFSRRLIRLIADIRDVIRLGHEEVPHTFWEGFGPKEAVLWYMHHLNLLSEEGSIHFKVTRPVALAKRTGIQIVERFDVEDPPGLLAGWKWKTTEEGERSVVAYQTRSLPSRKQYVDILSAQLV
jgi:hypothetical protein